MVMQEMKEKKAQQRERCIRERGHEMEERKGARCLLLNYPLLSSFFVLSCLIIGTASLIRIPSSKPKSIIRPFIDYSFPNISRFNLINIEPILRLTT